MMYLMLSVAGHMTIFLTRTRGPFWSIRPAMILCVATGGTQVVATLIAVYGFLMPPLGWGWAGFVWAYALIWALVSDPVSYTHLGHIVSVASIDGEDDDGRSMGEKLINEGVQEAEHDQMLQAARANEKKDQRGR